MAQIVVAGTQVVGKAFIRAVQQEVRASQHAAKQHGGGKAGRKKAAEDALTGLTLEVLKQINNLDSHFIRWT